MRRRRDDAPTPKRPGEKGQAAPRLKGQNVGKDQRAKPRFDKKGPAKPRRPDAEKAPPAPQEKAYAGERVAKVMARAGACSRRDAEQWIAEGRVAVNGRTLTSPAFNVREGDAIAIDGQPLAERERTRLFLFHKPAGLVTSAKDPEGRETVFDFIAKRLPELPRLVSIGRLDINTEGLLLLSNDGSLARVLELPATGWTRRYRVRAHGEVDQAMLDELAKGVTIDDINYAPIDARLDRIQGANAWITISLSEGKNREIKRVLEHLRLDVTRLIRVSFGPFQLGDLAEGAVEEVRLKILREQLGKGLAELAGVDFSSPLREAPSATESEAARVAAQNRPRKHVSAMRQQRADKTDEKAPRARIERAVTADRKGRAVAVERVVVKKAAGVAQGRNARRFEALRRENEGEGAAPRPPRAFGRGGPRQTARADEHPRRDREAPAFKREGANLDRPRKPREDRGFGARADERKDRATRSGERARPHPPSPHPRRDGGGAGAERSRKAQDGRSFEPRGEERRERAPRRDREAPSFKREDGANIDRSRKDERPRRHRESSFRREEGETFERPRKPRGGGAPQSRFKREGGKSFEGPRKPLEERPKRTGKAPPRKPGGGKGKAPPRAPRGSR